MAIFSSLRKPIGPFFFSTRCSSLPAQSPILPGVFRKLTTESTQQPNVLNPNRIGKNGVQKAFVSIQLKLSPSSYNEVVALRQQWLTEGHSSYIPQDEFVTLISPLQAHKVRQLQRTVSRLASQIKPFSIELGEPQLQAAKQSSRSRVVVVCDSLALAEVRYMFKAQAEAEATLKYSDRQFQIRQIFKPIAIALNRFVETTDVAKLWEEKRLHESAVKTLNVEGLVVSLRFQHQDMQLHNDTQHKVFYFESKVKEAKEGQSLNKSVYGVDVRPFRPSKAI